MKTKTLIVIAAVLLVGCWDQEDDKKRDCTKPRNQQEQQECALDAFTRSGAIPNTPPTNTKKWGI